MGDMILWFPKGRKKHSQKFKKWCFSPYKIQYCFPNNIILLVNINKFEPNPILVNINKFKPYWSLGQAPKWLKATIQGGREHKEDSKNKKDLEHKEDSREDFQHDYTKNQTKDQHKHDPRNAST